MCTTLEKLEVLDRETGIMLDELTYEVRQLFPEDKIPVSLMTTIYLSAKLNYPLQLAAAMNEIPNPDLRNYVMNMITLDWSQVTGTSFDGAKKICSEKIPLVHFNREAKLSPIDNACDLFKFGGY
uniref:Uncharacterized protein n=1 Tax=Glossina pallidipes TaxID=7398 RepID=A0A1A9ZC83_GLOPL